MVGWGEFKSRGDRNFSFSTAFKHVFCDLYVPGTVLGPQRYSHEPAKFLPSAAYAQGREWERGRVERHTKYKNKHININKVLLDGDVTMSII